MIVFVASAVVSAALHATSTPGRAWTAAQKRDALALSAEVLNEIASVLARPRFATSILAARRIGVLEGLARAAIWFTPTERVTDCRDVKDNKYRELAAPSRARVSVTGDIDLLVPHPWRRIDILRPAEFLKTSGSD